MTSLPETIDAVIDGYDRTELLRCRAPSRIVMLDAPGRGPLLLKIARGLAEEAERLDWLKGRLPAPEVIAFVPGDVDHLVMTRMPGIDGTEAHTAMPHATFVRELATGLRRMHALPVSECAFAMPTSELIERAQSAVTDGTVTASDLSPLYAGETPAELLAHIRRLRPDVSNSVVCHGDPSLPNMLFEGGIVTGYIDVGLLGVSEPWRDIAIVSRSLAWNIGARWIRPFCDDYGVDLDQRRLRFWQLMDEFVMARKV